jgi:prepilin-type N-terminal cleavage/methylation domain-containing protein
LLREVAAAVPPVHRNIMKTFKKTDYRLQITDYWSGFTLIELLVAIAIVGLLSGISLFALQGTRQAGRDAKRKSDLEAIAAGLEMFKADCRIYPTSLPVAGSALTGSTSFGCPAPGNTNTYISQRPGDPVDPARTYSYNRITTTTYVICASLELPANAADPHRNVSNCAACAGGCNWAVRSP